MSRALASLVGLLALLLGASVSTQVKADSDFKVTLLGTGTRSGSVWTKHARRSGKFEIAV
jgi:hypothetical protein